MRLSTVIDALDRLAPPHLAEPWDKVGLQVGDPRQGVRRGLLCIDLTEEVMAEAVRARAQLIVAYHPPIFEPLAQLREDGWKGRVIRAAVKRGIAIYSPHTALDAAPGGLNDWLSAGLGAGECRPIRVSSPSGAGRQYKLVTFVPHKHADALRRALAAAGAGRIGNYTECSFSVAGEGTFRGGAGSNPAVGKAGQFEQVSELRLEMVVDQADLGAAVSALRRVHPYEEPAFDLRALEVPPEPSGAGQGRVLELAKSVSAAALAERVRRRLGVKHVEVATPGKPRRARALRRIGLCAGAGGSLLKEAGVIDAFVTGEMRHHDVLDAVQRGIVVLLAGHTQTERPYLRVYRRRIEKVVVGVKWFVSGL